MADLSGVRKALHGRKYEEKGGGVFVPAPAPLLDAEQAWRRDRIRRDLAVIVRDLAQARAKSLPLIDSCLYSDIEAARSAVVGILRGIEVEIDAEVNADLARAEADAEERAEARQEAREHEHESYLDSIVGGRY